MLKLLYKIMWHICYRFGLAFSSNESYSFVINYYAAGGCAAGCGGGGGEGWCCTTTLVMNAWQ